VEGLSHRIADNHPCRSRHPACHGIDPGQLEGLPLHPWLRLKLLLRMLLDASWDPETAELVKPRGVAVVRELRAALRAGWFN
jgi:hypothetical protein